MMDKNRRAVTRVESDLLGGSSSIVAGLAVAPLFGLSCSTSNSWPVGRSSDRMTVFWTVQSSKCKARCESSVVCDVADHA
jgi:hypothetical protein